MSRSAPDRPPRLKDLVRTAAERLAVAGVPSPGPDAASLLAHVLHLTPAELQRAMVLGDTLPGPGSGSADPAARFEELVERRADRVPLQHLTGRAAFRRIEVDVGPGVFVPRPETELVAELVIAAAREQPNATVVDLCSGSGAIAFSVKDELPTARVYAVEQSELAHAWATRSRDRLGLLVELRVGDARTALPELAGRVDVVACNPPYIPLGAVPKDAEVRDHDPELALYGGSESGLAIPLAVAARAAELVRAGGVLVMEHADVQGEALSTALSASGSWVDVSDHRDLADRPRAVTAHRRGRPAAR